MSGKLNSLGNYVNGINPLTGLNYQAIDGAMSGINQQYSNSCVRFSASQIYDTAGKKNLSWISILALGNFIQTPGPSDYCSYAAKVLTYDGSKFETTPIITYKESGDASSIDYNSPD